MDYRLLYDASTGYEDLDLGDEAPAMNYQIGNLNELKDRQAAYSQRIKLPKTAKNMRTLGFLDSFAVVADAAYTPRRCKLLCEGVQISPVGAVLYVDDVDDYAGGSIDCQIVSDTVDLFSLLGDVENEQMGDDIWKGVWTSQQIVEDNADEGGMKRWPAVFTRQGQTPGNLFPLGGVQIYNLVPCYRFSTMVEQLFRMYGYRVESDIFNDPYMQSLYITASKITEDSDVSVRYYGKQAVVPSPGDETSYFSSSVKLNRVSQVETLGGSVMVDNDAPSAPKLNQWRYVAAQPGDYKLDIAIHNTGVFPLDGQHRLHLNVFATRGASQKTQTILDEDVPATSSSIPPMTSLNMSIEVPNLNTGDYIGWEILIYSGPLDNFTYVNVSARVSLIREDAVPGIGSPFDFARATGFKSYKELVQTFMQLFGVLVDVVQAPNVSEDGIVGTIRMNTFAELYRRRDAGQYVDWSNKIVLDNERNVGFSLANYAQWNFIQLTDNTDDGTHDEGSFAVNNRTLASEKTLFTIPIEAGRNLTYGSKTAAVVPTIDPVIETDDEGAETMTPTYKGCAAHLLRIDESTRYRTQIATGFYTYNRPYYEFPQALTVRMQDLIDRYYAPIRRLMSHARTISAHFNLNALDISQLDLFTPVWLKPYGCYFYISKISNFIAGQPTKVELVKMSSVEDQIKYYLTLNGRDENVETTAPAAATAIRVVYRTNGTLKIVASGAAVDQVVVRNNYLEVQTKTNTATQGRAGTVEVSLDEDPKIVHTITIWQEGVAVPPDIYLKLTTDGTNLYVQTSRPLANDEEVMILTRGCGRVLDRAGAIVAAGKHHRSRLRWHKPDTELPRARVFPVDATGKISLENSRNSYKWRLDSGTNGNPNKYVHIDKANWSRGFGYKAVDGLNKAVTFAVAVYKKTTQLSNRCYFESRCHFRNGQLTQEFVVPE